PPPSPSSLHDALPIYCVSHRFMKEMSKSAALLEPDGDEFEYAGLAPAEGAHVAAPYVKEALLVYECTLHDIVRLGNGPGSGNLIDRKSTRLNSSHVKI